MKVAQRRKSLCEVAESLIRRLQNTSSWTGSEAECRDAVCVACSQRSCGESLRSKLQRVSSEDLRTPVLGQAVNQSAEMRSALEFFATAHSFPERSLESVNCTGFEDTLNILAESLASHGDNCPPSRGRDCTPSAEKYVHMVSAMESRLGPSTQDRAEHLTAETGHLL